MSTRFCFSAILSLGLFISGHSLQAISYPIHAYRSYHTPHMQKMEIIGQVSAKTRITTSTRKRLLDYDNREMMITARLFEEEGLRLGDTVYIIKKEPDHKRFKNGYIIGEVEIFSIFKTEFQGWMLKARGNLSMVKKGHFIARLDRGNDRRDAWVFYRRGDKYRHVGDYANAYKYYRKSLDKDPNRPETYFRLARLGYQRGRKHEALNYLEEAWNRLNKFENVNDVLELPGFYLARKVEKIRFNAGSLRYNCSFTQVHKIRCKQLKGYLALLQQERKYKKLLNWFKHSIRPEIVSLIEKKGLPKYEFQYQKALIFKEIFTILSEKRGGKVKSIGTVLHWLEKEEREIFYEPLAMPYNRARYAYPRKAWDLAFFDAAIYHLQLAHELKPLDNRASFQLVDLIDERLKQGPPRKEREDYTALLKHYAIQFNRVNPVKTPRSQRTRVNNILASRRINLP